LPAKSFPLSLVVDVWHGLISKTVTLGTEVARCGAAGRKRP